MVSMPLSGQNNGGRPRCETTSEQVLELRRQGFSWRREPLGLGQRQWLSRKTIVPIPPKTPKSTRRWERSRRASARRPASFHPLWEQLFVATRRQKGGAGGEILVYDTK